MNYRKEKDTGVYYCLARNINGKARSHNATIEIASKFFSNSIQFISKTKQKTKNFN